MSNQQRKPGRMIWAITSLVVVFVLYPLSFGPAMKFLQHVPVPESVGTTIVATYYPLYSIVLTSEAATLAAQRYVYLWDDFSTQSANPGLLGR